jgi:predicted DCC family thiol-disulfide oxidoreductase YuxK
MDDTPMTVLYDSSCGLCRRLAEYGKARSEGVLHFVSWQEFALEPIASSLFNAEELESPPRHLRTLHNGETLEDADAWAAILNAYPPFESLSWVAERLGFMGTFSRVTYYGGQWLRGRCKDCP